MQSRRVDTDIEEYSGQWGCIVMIWRALSNILTDCSGNAWGLGSNKMKCKNIKWLCRRSPHSDGHNSTSLSLSRIWKCNLHCPCLIFYVGLCAYFVLNYVGKTSAKILCQAIVWGHGFWRTLDMLWFLRKQIYWGILYIKSNVPILSI